MIATTGPAAVEIRPLSAADWAALRAVRLVALTEAPEAFGSTLERELGFDEQRWRERLDATAHIGARRGGELVGILAGFHEPAADELAPGVPAAGERAIGPAAGDPADVGLAAPGQRGWHLTSMWVSPRERGRGVADRLVAALAELVRADDAEYLSLWVTEVNLRAAAFYRRAGFRQTRIRQLVRPEQPDHWETLMVRDLRPPRPAGRKSGGRCCPGG